jgi:hypothetical protein
MCYKCYKENGKPKVVSEQTRNAAALVAKVYEASCVGGNLHIIVDDWNIQDSHIEFCKKAIEDNVHELTPTEQQVERECLAALRSLDIAGRASALALHDGFLSNAQEATEIESALKRPR